LTREEFKLHVDEGFISDDLLCYESNLAEFFSRCETKHYKKSMFTSERYMLETCKNIGVHLKKIEGGERQNLYVQVGKSKEKRIFTFDINEL
jgi:hypothetical protein